MLNVENMGSTGAIPKRGTLEPSLQRKTNDQLDEEDGGHLAELGITVQNPRPFWSSQVCLKYSEEN